MNLRLVMVAAAGSFVLAIAGAGCSSSSSNGGSSSSADSVGAQCGKVAQSYCRRVIIDCAPQVDGGGTGATEQDRCSQMAQPSCDRIVACDSTQNASTCTSDFVDGCCAHSGMCGLPALTDDATMQSCISAIGSWSCADVLAHNTPTQCQHIVRPAPSDAAATACTTAVQSQCCDPSGSCSQTPKSTAAQVDACVSALQSATCDALVAGNLPAECYHVVTYAAPMHFSASTPTLTFAIAGE